MWPHRALGSDQEGRAEPTKPPVGVHAGCRPLTLGQGACLGFDEELWGPQAHSACICWWWPSSWEAAGDEALGTSTVSVSACSPQPLVPNQPWARVLGAAGNVPLYHSAHPRRTVHECPLRDFSSNSAALKPAAETS